MDSTSMSIDQINSCCGIGEIENLEDDPKVDVTYVWHDHCDGDGYSLDEGFSMYVFTDNIAYKNGRRLAAYIRRMKLGKITASPITQNHKHNSKVRLWIWVVNRKNLKTWGKKHKVETCTHDWDCNCPDCD